MSDPIALSGDVYWKLRFLQSEAAAIERSLKAMQQQIAAVMHEAGVPLGQFKWDDATTSLIPTE
jgi:hypothetical protein